MLAVAATAYAAFPVHHGDPAARPHRHADGSVHVHVEAERARSAPEKNAGATHGGLHAHGGRVHAHGLAAHSHLTAPEAVVQRVALRSVPPLVGAETVGEVPREVTYTDGPRALHAQSRPSVETPPPIAHG